MSQKQEINNKAPIHKTEYSELINTMSIRTVTFDAMNPVSTFILRDVTVVYEPSVFGGDGTELRKNIVFEIPPSAIHAIHDLESKIDPRRLCSSIKDFSHLKCKIQMDKIAVYDTSQEIIPHPEFWRGFVVNVAILVKGIWHTKMQSGLSIEASSIQVLCTDSQCPPACPFQAVLAS